MTIQIIQKMADDIKEFLLTREFYDFYLKHRKKPRKEISEFKFFHRSVRKLIDLICRHLDKKEEGVYLDNFLYIYFKRTVFKNLVLKEIRDCRLLFVKHSILNNDIEDRWTFFPYKRHMYGKKIERRNNKKEIEYTLKATGVKYRGVV